MLNKKLAPIRYSEITKKADYLNRRSFIVAAGIGGAGLVAGKLIPDLVSPDVVHAGTKLDYKKSDLSKHCEELTPLKEISSYNNCYEFGTDKGDPTAKAQNFR